MHCEKGGLRVRNGRKTQGGGGDALPHGVKGQPEEGEERLKKRLRLVSADWGLNGKKNEETPSRKIRAEISQIG